jgi:hypothetical protein
VDRWQTEGQESVLPIWASVADSYRLFGHHAAALIKSSWVALVLLVLALLLFGGIAATAGERSAGAAVGVLVLAFAMVLLEAAVQVSWLRILLLGEPARHGLRLGRREFTYFGYLLLAALAAIAPLVALALIGGAAAGKAGFAVGGLVGIALAIWIGARLSMMAPLVAVDRSDRPLQASWNGTRGLAPRLVLIPLLTLLPLYVATALLRNAGPALNLLLALPLNFCIAGLIVVCVAVMYARIGGTPLPTGSANDPGAG